MMFFFRLTVQDFKKITEFDTDGNGEVTDEEAKSYLGGADELDFEAFFERSFDEIRVILRPRESEKREATEEPKSEKEENTEEELEDEYSASSEPERVEDEWEKRPPYSEATQKIIDGKYIIIIPFLLVCFQKHLKLETTSMMLFESFLT